jgi:hypothetical protein
MRNFGGIYMVTKCLENWQGDTEIRRLCEETDNAADPLSSQIPVTDKKTATTYRNLHCALCNTDPASLAEIRDQWEMWGARLECPTVLTGSRDLASVRQALRFENGTWGLRLPRHISGTSPQPPPKNETADKFDKLDKLQALLQQSSNETRPRYRGRKIDYNNNERTTTESTTTMQPIAATNSGLRKLSRRQYGLYNASQFHRNDSALSTLLRQRRLHTSNVRLKRDTEPEPEEEQVFHRCDVDPLLPDTLTHLVRRCRPDVISECPQTWGDENVSF